MLLKHFFTHKIAHSSYMLVGNRFAVVIDPRRDVDIYIQEARALGVAITHIFQTHLHADFVSGHIELAEKTGAQIYAAESAKCMFEYTGLAEGDSVDIEDMKLVVLETPGHTPEHLSFVVIDTSRSDQPVGVFTGDTLFVGDVGRPDLFPEQSTELASKLYHSLHDKLMKLPDYCEIYPAHGAGSLCGRAMGSKMSSTIGYERHFNSALQIKDKSHFIKSLTENMPPAPDHFSRLSEINRRGPLKTADLPRLERLSPAGFAERMKEHSMMVVDTRSYAAFGGCHIPGAMHIELDGNFPTFAGWMLPVNGRFLLVGDTWEKAEEAVTWARRTGVDNIEGFLGGGMLEWSGSGLDLDCVIQVSAKELHDRLTGDETIVLLDVRSPEEYEDNHIEGAVNIPVADLRTRWKELHPEKKTILLCSSGMRSSMGASILKRHGIKNIMNLAGGMSGYSAAGYTGECLACTMPHGSRFHAGHRETHS